MTQYDWEVTRQQGSALIVALVFLLVMTLIGTTAMQGTSQQESMAGNVRNRNLAFQAAEAALRAAENALDGGATGTALVSNRDWTTFDWTTATGYVGALDQIIAPPRYVIENVGWVTTSGGESLAVNTPGMGSEFYQITARGLGGTADAVVILQTTYKR